MMNILPSWGRLALSTLLIISGVALFAQPANNDCSSAEVLMVQDFFDNTPVPGTNVDATASGEIPAPSCSSFGTGEDVWYSFTASANGTVVEMSDNGGPGDFAMSIYSGSCGALTEVECDDDDGPLLFPRIESTDLIPGDVYFVRVFEFGNNSFGPFNIVAFALPDPPSYDACASPAMLPIQFAGFEEPDTFNNIFATASGEIPAPSCSSFGSGEDVYFSFTATEEDVTIEMSSVAGNPTDFAMSAYSGMCGALVEIECDDDDGPGLMPRLDLTGLTVGETFLVRVFEFGNNATGSFRIAATVAAPDPITIDCPATDSVFVGADCTAELADYTAMIMGMDPADTDGDNTDGFTLMQDSTAGSLLGLVDDSTSTFDLTVTAMSDVNPSTTTCVIAVSVVDTTTPVLVCQDIAVDLDPLGIPTLDSMMLADSIIVEASDNCVFTLTQDDEPNLTCSADGMTMVSFTLADGSGGSVSCTSAITIQDEGGFCDGNLVVQCSEQITDTLFVTEALCMVTTLDYTDGPLTNADTVRQEPEAGEMLPVGDTVILVISELGMMADTCIIEVSVQDTFIPTFTCQDVEVFVDAAGTATISVDSIITSLSDNCTDSATINITILSGEVFSCGPPDEEVTAIERGAVAGTLPALATAGAGASIGTCDCPDGFIAVGYEGRGGAGVDQFILLCAELMADGTLGTDLVSTCASGTSTGGGPRGPENIGPLVGGAARIGDLIDDVEVYSQTVDYIVNGGDNMTGFTTSARFNPANNGGTMTDMEFAPAGNVIVGMNVFTPGQFNTASGIEFRFAPISEVILSVGNTGTSTLLFSDASMNVDSCTVNVTVTDTIAPVLTVTDEMVTIDLAGNGSLNLSAIASAVDNCDTDVELTTDRPLDFDCSTDVGLVVIRITATDDSGNSTLDSVEVMVDFEEPNLACVSRVNVTLDDQCSFELEPSQLLVGNVACLDAISFDITVMDGDPSNGPIIDGCGVFTYKIERTFGPNEDPTAEFPFFTCWGTVTAEDKTPPVLVETPMNVNTLLCADVEANNINALGPEVSKCFLVDGAGAVIPGSMDVALRAVLSPDAFDDVSPDTALIPTFTDNCASAIEVCVSDIVTPSDDNCGAVRIERFFTATEAMGCGPLAGEEAEEVSIQTSFELVFVRPTLDSLDVSGIQPTVDIDACGSLTSPLEFLPREEDMPMLAFGERSISLGSPNSACSMIAMTFEDSPNPIQTCPHTVKFQRTFTIVDWCDPTDVRTVGQFIAIGDATGPNFQGPAATFDAEGNADAIITYRTNVADECSAIVRLDGAGVGAVDVCSGNNVIITALIFPDGDVTQAPFGRYEVDLTNGVAELSDALAVGAYAFQYTATDECGNSTVTMVPFEVVDGSSPTAICENGLNVSLSRPAGLAVLTPAEIDKGSTDNCDDELTFQIGSSNGPEGMGGSFDDELVFTCDSIGTRFVVLEVQDQAENTNTCWLEVTVELKSNDIPTCIAPSNVSMTCTEVSAALPTGNLIESTSEELDAAFGSATAVGTCGATLSSTLTNSTLNECGIGTIVRAFEATDAQGVMNTGNCAQLITVVGLYDYQIILPGDARSNECTGEFEADELEIVGGDCDLPVVSPVTEEILNTAGIECYQIRTTYTIINTCEYDPAFGATTVISRQGLNVADNAPIYLNVVSQSPTTEDDDLAFVSSSANGQFTPGDDDDVEITGYATSVGRGSFTYVQNINVFDRIAPVVTVLDAPTECVSGCSADLSLNFTVEEDCDFPLDNPQLELDPNYDAAAGFEAGQVDGVIITLDAADAANGNYVINATNVPAGDHAIRISATDICGNVNPVIVEISVCGDVAPTPLCIQTLVAVLQMSDDGSMAMAEVWAIDFLTDSPLLDCFGNEVTKFGIVRAGEGPATPEDVGMKVFCDDFGDFVAAEVYAFDDAGNTAEFCSVLIDVQEGDGVECPSGPNIAGQIVTPGSTSLRGVAVTLTGSEDMDEMQMTNDEGRFDFVELPFGGDYTVTPAHNVPVNLQEVKISDVVMISNVILGASGFDSPYDYLAADVDQSGALNVLDMVSIQRVILGLDDTFTTGDSWGFVPADVDVSNPYASTFPQVYNMNDLTASVLDADFVGFAYGNVAGEGRTALNLNATDAKLEAGQTHTLELSGDDLLGFQGTIELAAGLELLGADYEGEGGLNLNYAATGQIAVALRGDATLSLEVRATEAGLLSELVTLSDAITVRGGVNAVGTAGSLSLNFSDLTDVTGVTSLGNAVPNPVVESTLINFTLATDSEVTLSIQDVQGRTILVRNLRGTQGLNGEVITLADLKGATGVLTYTLVAGDFSATKKMVVVR